MRTELAVHPPKARLGKNMGRQRDELADCIIVYPLYPLKPSSRQNGLAGMPKTRQMVCPLADTWPKAHSPGIHSEGHSRWQHQRAFPVATQRATTTTSVFIVALCPLADTWPWAYSPKIHSEGLETPATTRPAAPKPGRIEQTVPAQAGIWPKAPSRRVEPADSQKNADEHTTRLKKKTNSLP